MSVVNLHKVAAGVHLDTALLAALWAQAIRDEAAATADPVQRALLLTAAEECVQHASDDIDLALACLTEVVS